MKCVQFPRIKTLDSPRHRVTNASVDLEAQTPEIEKIKRSHSKGNTMTISTGEADCCSNLLKKNS